MNRFGASLQTFWDWRAAGNFMFGGAGSALVFMASVASFPEPPPRALGLIALALVGLGLFSVWLEIGRPWRFMHVFFHPQTSWMTREASVAVLLFVFTFLGIAFNSPFIMCIAGIIGVVFLFCQGRMLKAGKGIPAWRESTIVLLIFVTGMCEGTALLLLFLSLKHEVSTNLEIACLIFLAGRVSSWLIYRKKLIESRAPGETLAALRRIHRIHVIAGNLFPALLIMLSMSMPEWMTSAIATASVLILIAGWHLKFTIITRAAQVQGYSFGKIRRGRPALRPPVRRKPDRFVF